MIRSSKYLSLFAMVVAFAGAGAQVPAADPSDKLREVLPADVAERVIDRIAKARAVELPAAALENRALKFAARGVPASDIEKSVNEHASRMEQARAAIEKGRGSRAQGAEIDAGAEAMRKGVDGAAISDLAKSASGRTLEVPLTVIGSLMDRDLPADAAIKQVYDKLVARAPDAEIEQLPAGVVAGKPATTGRELADTKRPANAGARPAGVPAGVPVNPGTSTSGTARPTPPVGKRP